MLVEKRAQPTIICEEITFCIGFSEKLLGNGAHSQSIRFFLEQARGRYRKSARSDYQAAFFCVLLDLLISR